MRQARHVARMEKSRAAFKIFMVTADGRRPLVRPQYRWKDNIKIFLKSREKGRGLN
jgi:hypothetical protein